MTEPTDFTERESVYSLFLVIAETELIETRAFADEAIRVTNELDSVFSELGESHVQVRGLYDLTGFDASASVMIWLTSAAVDDLQWASRQLRRTQLLGDTLVIESILARGVSDLDDEARSWVSLAPVSPGFTGGAYDNDEIDDPDVDNLDVEDFEEDEFASEGRDAQTPPGETLEVEDFGAEPVEIGEIAGAAPGDLPDDSESASLETTSLHAQIGIGPIRMFAVVEADEPGELIGPSLGLLDGGLMTVATPRTGRLVTPAELYEILR